ncbi:PREDICTED: uncharacterized protein LOC104810035 [Tarenaya hassleriana]|uniref:uncharacterized protein LOC104810035 n=1 Tax=Tarenaya hassleriana TaxID=28532 RepID=UPI00053C6213|nr:PREDICTED: uncharacterized protein LOC104810035 [Tarenaya hassleriana]
MASVLTRTGSGPQFYLGDEWKLSKKEISGGGASRNRITRSSSMSSSFSGYDKAQKQGKCAFTRKCARLVKEQRARFYIVRRCVVMLICWRDYTDS